MRLARTLTLSAVTLVLAAATARAADTVIPAGSELLLTGDIILTGADKVVAGDDSGARCIIHADGWQIVTAGDGWTGSVTIKNCDVDNLGEGGIAAIGTKGGQAVTIEGSTFSLTSEIAVETGEATSITIRNNVFREDSVVAIVDSSLDRSQNAFTFKGKSTGAKVFQGNVVRKSRLSFENTADWQIGGLLPGEGNVLAGPRVGIFIDRSGAMTIQGNYSRTGERGWNQVKNLNVYSPGGGPLIVEHNIFIGMGWNTEVNDSGELRYNLFANPVERAWVQVWASGGPKIHHNLLVQTSDNKAAMIAGGFVVFPGDNSSDMPGPSTVEIYNNTFDAGGTCNAGLAGAVNTDGQVASLHSNAFVGIRLPGWTGIGLVGTRDKTLMSPLPPLLGYADYNLFYNPDGSVKANYSAGVDGLALRVDDGFGYHDVPEGGAPNAQVNPKFAGPIPRAFPFKEADLLAGTVSVCQILAFYRAAYAPGAGSPLIDAGDPIDGDGNDIGAVGAGADDPLDQFGKLCDPATVAPLVVDSKIYQCGSVPIGGTGPLGGIDDGGPPPGITCVCQAGAGAGAPGGLAAAVALAALALGARRRRRA